MNNKKSPAEWVKNYQKKDAVCLLHRTKMPGITPASIAWHKDGIRVADVESGDIFLINPETGDILSQFPSLVRRPQTISSEKDLLWEYDEETMNLYRRDLAENTNHFFGNVDGVIVPYLGLTTHEKDLWLLSPDQPYFTVSDNIISVIKFPRSIKAAEFKAPTHSCRGLCHDGKLLWTLDIEDNEVYAMDPETGLIFTSYSLPGVSHASSIIVKDDRIWTMDLASDELLTYSLDRTVQRTASGGRHSKVDIVETIRNNGPGTIKSMKLSQTLPQNYVSQTLLKQPVVVPPPTSTKKGQWADSSENGEVIIHELTNLAPGNEQAVTVQIEVETVNLKWHIYPDQTGTLEDIPQKIKEQYLFSEMKSSKDSELTEIVNTAQALFQTENTTIKEKVQEVLDGETNPYLMARKLYNFVVDKVDYVLPYSSISSETILKQGKGSCGNHATIFIALCQAAGLPARSIIGYGVWKKDSRLGYLDHEIPEVYLPNYGWVPADTSRFMALPIRGNNPLNLFRSFGSLSDRFFVNGFGRDMTSESAREYYTKERLTITDGECRPEYLMFIRWRQR